MTDKGFRVGEVVQVKSVAEIMATLDERGTKGALPFMPEMLQFAGRSFTVDQRAEKICDTTLSGSRRIDDVVLLGDLRCDGSAHDGCQAECRLLWKESWLRRVKPGEQADADPVPARAADLAALAATTKSSTPDGGERYRCQATEITAASRPLKLWDPRAYLRVLLARNVSFMRFARVMLRVVIDVPRRKMGFLSDLAFAKPGDTTTPTKTPPLGLLAGERVRVKSAAEIASTLNRDGKHRGLWFDREMLPFCGRSFEVRRRLTHFINDKDGQMIRLKSDCLTLEGVVCSGEHSFRRWFCPREIYPYWRESWLERAPNGETIAREETA